MHNLTVWRLHPHGMRLEKAEPTLHDHANPAALKYCGPYTFANRQGFWLYPAFDMDVQWTGERFIHIIHNNFDDQELYLKGELTEDPQSKQFLQEFPGRLKYDFGRVEPNIGQFWTGCIFQTPPGWCLQVRSPVNLGQDRGYTIQEGVIDSDWMPYDLWINVIFLEKYKWVFFRKNQWPPLAQIIPIPRESSWKHEEKTLTGQDGMFLQWCQYNYKKYLAKGEKDSSTFHKERKTHVRPVQSAQDSGSEVLFPTPESEISQTPRPRDESVKSSGNGT